MLHTKEKPYYRATHSTTLNDVRIHNPILASSSSSCVHDYHLGYMYRTYKFALKFCFCIEKRKSISGICPWILIGGFAPGPHRGPGSHKARARCALRVFTLFARASNGAPNHPLPTGTRKQSYATAIDNPPLHHPHSHTTPLNWGHLKETKALLPDLKIL